MVRTYIDPYILDVWILQKVIRKFSEGSDSQKRQNIRVGSSKVL